MSTTIRFAALFATLALTGYVAGDAFAGDEAPNAGRPPGKACSTAAPTTAPTAAPQASDGTESDLAATAEDVATSEAGGDWRVFATLYGWLPNFKGDVTVDGKKSHASLTRSDIWNNLDLAAMGRVEVVPPGSEWSVWTDIFWSSLEADDSAVLDVGPTRLGLKADLDLDFTVRMTFFEVAVARDVWNSEETIGGLRESAPRTQLDAFGGARYSRMRVKLDVDATLGPFARGGRLDKSEDWIDPFVGLRLLHGLAPDWWVLLRGDVGGFGVGTSSKLAWTATATIQHIIHEDLSVGVGWKTMDLDYERGSFEADVRMGGPFVTLTYEF